VDDPVILVVYVFAAMDSGYDIGKAGKTVFLAKQIPPECICIADENEYE
jgi:RNA:NAD 2'-phosphotransferase (TPT1/KptA family)